MGNRPGRPAKHPRDLALLREFAAQLRARSKLSDAQLEEALGLGPGPKAKASKAGRTFSDIAAGRKTAMSRERLLKIADVADTKGWVLPFMKTMIRFQYQRPYQDDDGALAVHEEREEAMRSERETIRAALVAALDLIVVDLKGRGVEVVRADALVAKDGPQLWEEYEPLLLQLGVAISKAATLAYKPRPVSRPRPRVLKL
jgi:hypothetical protein